MAGMGWWTARLASEPHRSHAQRRSIAPYSAAVIDASPRSVRRKSSKVETGTNQPGLCAIRRSKYSARGLIFPSRTNPEAKCVYMKQHTTFSLELFLIRLADRLAKACRVRPIAAAERVFDKWSQRISVRHRRVYAIQVHFAEDKIANVIDLVLAKVAPEVWTFRVCPSNLRVLASTAAIPRGALTY